MSSDASPKSSDLADFARLLHTLDGISGRTGKQITVHRALKASPGMLRFFSWSLVDSWPITSEDAYQASKRMDLSRTRVWTMGEWFFAVKNYKMDKQVMAEAWASIVLRLPQSQRFAANRVLNRDLRGIDAQTLSEALNDFVPF